MAQDAPHLLPPHDAAACANPAAGSTAATTLDLAKAALARGDANGARTALDAVLALHPFAKDVVRLRCDAAASPDERVRFLARFVAAGLEDNGTLKPDPKLKTAFGAELDAVLALASLRSAAMQELVKHAQAAKPGTKELGSNLGVDLAIALVEEATRFAPKPRRAVRKDLLAAHERAAPDPLPVVKELAALIKKALAPAPKGAASQPTSADPADDLLTASRLLAGLCRQARFQDLQGVRPTLPDEYATLAQEGIARARETIHARSVPLAIAELEAMDEAQRLEFTARHRTWANPARARSKTGKYVIETVCGHAVLLGVAKTIELHHARLVAWNDGKDPFEERQGSVRIVPEPEDLESEGVPHWWAAGFQGGDQTHFVLRWGSLEELGHGLTHELCHRFDGALHAFLPAWAVEGRAVHVGGAFGAAEEPRFVERFLQPAALSTAYVDGYGDRGKLEKLVSGTITDYRDNYTAGYALWAFLATWQVRTEDDGPLFAEPLERWLATLRAAGKDPVAHFTKCFADGKGGRPADLDAFAELFRNFLKGGYDRGFDRRVEWMERYRVAALTTLTPRIAEEPNYSWGRNRVEPWFGTEHATAIGRFFAARGNPTVAAQALLWAREVDGLAPRDVDLLIAQLEALGRTLPAAILRAERGIGSDVLVGAFPKCAALLEGLAKEAQRVAGSVPSHARALLGERATLAAALGAPAVPGGSGAEPALPLTAFGLCEGGLVDYERRRVAGLWFESGTGDLHVGRERPRDETGLLDREAHQRHAFVKTKETWAGEYVFRAKVHLTTSYVSGALVLGASRRDRGVLVTFSAGDFLYSIGQKTAGDTIKEVRVGVKGTWAREEHLAGARTEVNHKFPAGTAAFLLEAHVRGPSVVVTIDGKFVTSYATPDASKIVGPIGVAMSQGAVRLQNPVVERVRDGDDQGRGLDLAATEGPAVLASRDRLVAGLPRDPAGTVLVVVPASYTKRKQLEPDDLARMLEPIVVGLGKDRDLRCNLVVAVPATLAKEMTPAAERVLAVLGARARVVTHSRTAPPEEEPLLGFVDGLGYLRAVMLFEPGMGVFGRVGTWARRWRTPVRP